MTPRFIKSAKGAYVTDVDGNTYIDYISSWGPMILGHSHPGVLEAVEKTIKDGLSFGAATELEVEMAEYICEHVPSMDMVRMVNSGTEAVMSALRLARGYTGRNKIIKFAGCYHGHCDAMLVKAGSGVMTAGVPDSAGVPEGCTQDTLTAVYNDAKSVEAILDRFPGEVAAIIVEPLAANMGLVKPQEGFLKELRELCTRHGALLIFDEVITGFRLAFGGAQEYFGVSADLATYGKIIGGGMPVGAYGGRREIMEMVAPLGGVYQAGTLSGNPVAMTAGLTQLKTLRENQDIYQQMKTLGEQLFGGIQKLITEYELPGTVNYLESLGCLYFTKHEVYNYETAKTADTKQFVEYFRFMLAHDIHLGPSQFEAMFISGAHTEETTEKTFGIIEKYMKSMNE
jgi:glutamate-1-semialdehyde 2,1-aminomutase